MLGCLVVDHIKNTYHTQDGKVVLIAVADVLLTKLIFEEFQAEEKSDELYQSRLKYFIQQLKTHPKSVNIKTWFQVAMIPIGLSAKTLDEAQLEAKRCLRIMDLKQSKKLEGEIIASLIFLGKEGLDKEVIMYFLEAEYQLDLKKVKTAFGHAIKSLLNCDNFETYIEEVCRYKRRSYRMMCGGLGQVYYNSLPENWVNPTLDALEDDIKSMSLSFMKTFTCLPTW